MSKGFLWIAQNNKNTDYVKISVDLCKSIKKRCTINNVCLITDEPELVPSGIFDKVVKLHHNDSASDEWKMSNEWKVFKYSPFTHTIKLEADMLFTKNTDWWWNFLCRHDMVFSYHCRDYKDNIVKNSPYRKMFGRNILPDVYNGLHYFRRSRYAENFYKSCENITKNWQYVRDNILINCHDRYPTTDVVYALANKIQDPLEQNKIDYEWFKFIHGKSQINQAAPGRRFYNYVSPYIVNDEIYLGGYRVNRIWHYNDKNIMEKINVRIF